MQTEEYHRFPVRKSPRLPDYDYSAPNYYFVTVCTKDKKCIFGEPGKLNRLGLIAEQGIKEISTHFPDVTVEKFVVMPNHIHAILVHKKLGTQLPVVVGQFKSFVTREIRRIQPDLQVWQSSFHDHVIRSQQAYEKIWNYIEGNPLKWGEDCFYVGEQVDGAQ